MVLGGAEDVGLDVGDVDDVAGVVVVAGAPPLHALRMLVEISISVARIKNLLRSFTLSSISFMI